MIPMLECRNLAFGYDTANPLFTDINCRVECGEMVSILGPNGAGKTTFLRLLSGALSPLHGVIELSGKNLSTMPRKTIARTIAFVPQELAMPFDYTARQMIEMGRTPYLSGWSWGMLPAEDKGIIEHALLVTKLNQLADRRYNALSGGERQRVLIAMALAQEPALLLLDEPTAHLDVRHQIEMLELVASLNQQTGMTVVATLHDLNLAARYFPRLILFQREIVADGPPSIALSPDLLHKVFQVKVHIGVMRGARYLSVVPPGSELATAEAAMPVVHVLAGGGTGDLVMRALTESAVPFSAGPMNIGDSDTALADHLAAAMIAEPPFAPFSEQSIVAATLAMTQARRVILCPAPIGPGNIGSIQAISFALAEGCRVWLFEPALADSSTEGILAHIAERDYTNGDGAKAYEQLLQMGAIVITNLPDLTAQVLASLDLRKETVVTGQ